MTCLNTAGNNTGKWHFVVVETVKNVYGKIFKYSCAPHLIIDTQLYQQMSCSIKNLILFYPQQTEEGLRCGVKQSVAELETELVAFDPSQCRTFTLLFMK